MGSQILLPLAVAAAFALACLPALALIRTSRVWIFLAALGIWVVSAAGLAYAAVRIYPPLLAEREIPDRPVQDLHRGYVSSNACRACHPQEYATWHASYHRTMTQLATPESVAGDFDDVDLTYHGLNYHLEHRGDELWVEMDDPVWTGPPERVPRIERRIVLTTGSHHDQGYWYVTPSEGRDLRLLPLAFRVQEKKWVPMTAAFMLPPNTNFQYSHSKWTQTCVKCHATYGEQTVMAATEQIDSRVAEFGIACEACHGPGSEHVTANRNPQHRYRLHFGDSTDPTITQPAKLTAAGSSEVCGQCHGQWSEREPGMDLEDSAERYRPGGDLEKRRIYQQFAAADPAWAAIDPQKHEWMRFLLEHNQDYIQSSFWSDGMIRISGREYTAMVESPCYRGGEFSCLSCHTMHQKPDDPRPIGEWTNDQLSVGMEGNGACLECHSEFATASALSAHTHHAPESTGSTCYNCHMPWTAYGILKAHRSHQIDSPAVAPSVATGRPNACNACHLDRTLAWTADQLASQYGIARPELDGDQSRVAASVLWALRGDAGQRVLAAAYMGWDAAIATSGSDWMIPYLSELMGDPYDAVRSVAGRSLGRHRGYEDVKFDYVGGRDRIEAAQAEVARRWAGASQPSRRPAVLQPDGSGLDQELYRRLLTERDDRPVHLDE